MKKAKEKNRFIIRLIRTYQNSKNEHNRKWCKFSPTCSNYALEAYQKFNFFKASFLTIYRIIRCNPFSKGGYDPVPLTKQEKLEQSSKETSNLINDTSEEIVNSSDKS